MTSSEAKPPTKEKTTSFNLEAFIKKPDADKRVHMASTYFDNADTLWANLYYHLTDKLQNLISQTKADAAKRAEKAMDDAATLNIPKKETTAVSENELRHKLLVNAISLFTTELDPTSRDKMKLFNLEPRNKEAIVSDFIYNLALEEPLSSATQESLDWLVNMAENGDAACIMLQNAKPEERSQLKDQLLASIPNGIAIHKGESTKLILAPELLPTDLSGIDLIIDIAHERGHDILHSYPELMAKKGESAIVFDEFFAALEQIRVIHSLSETQKRNITNTDWRVFADMDPTSQQNVTIAMAVVYKHALFQLLNQGGDTPLFTRAVGR